MACLGPFGPSLFYSLQLLCVVGIFVISLVQLRKLRPREAPELAQVALGAEEPGSEVGFLVIFNGVLSTLLNTKHSPFGAVHEQSIFLYNLPFEHHPPRPDEDGDWLHRAWDRTTNPTGHQTANKKRGIYPSCTRTPS